MHFILQSSSLLTCSMWWATEYQVVLIKKSSNGALLCTEHALEDLRNSKWRFGQLTPIHWKLQAL